MSKKSFVGGKVLLSTALALSMIVSPFEGIGVNHANASVVVNQGQPNISVTSTEDGKACIDYSGIQNSVEYEDCYITGYGVEMWYTGIENHYEVNEDGNYVLAEKTTGTKAWAYNGSYTDTATFVFTIRVYYKDVNGESNEADYRVKFTVNPASEVAAPTEAPTVEPTPIAPTVEPTVVPTAVVPTVKPTDTPIAPTVEPTVVPTAVVPTVKPTGTPIVSNAPIASETPIKTETPIVSNVPTQTPNNTVVSSSPVPTDTPQSTSTLSVTSKPDADKKTNNISTTISKPKIESVKRWQSDLSITVGSLDKNADGYEIKLVDYKTGKVVDKTESYVALSNLGGAKTSKIYYLQARALKNVSDKTYYSSWSAKKYIIPQSKAEYETILKMSGARCTVSWKKIKNASSYTIYCKSKKSDKYKKIAQTSSKKTKYKFRPTRGKTYYFSIVTNIKVNGKTYSSGKTNYTWYKFS